MNTFKMIGRLCLLRILRTHEPPLLLSSSNSSFSFFESYICVVVRALAESDVYLNAYLGRADVFDENLFTLISVLFFVLFLAISLGEDEDETREEW